MIQRTYRLAIAIAIAAPALLLSACDEEDGGMPPSNTGTGPRGTTTPDPGKPPGVGGGETPPPECGGDAVDAPAQALDFANNLLASPSPPGNLTPTNAPQIVVFGWDDVENDAGIAF